eukprot:403370699
MIGTMKTKCQEGARWDGVNQYGFCGEEITVGNMKSHWEKCPQRQYECSWCNKDRLIQGRQEFIKHIVENHNQLMVSVFDQKLEGKLMKTEIDRIQLKNRKQETIVGVLNEDDSENVGDIDFSDPNNVNQIMQQNDGKSAPRLNKDKKNSKSLAEEEKVNDTKESVTDTNWECQICANQNHLAQQICQYCGTDFEMKKHKSQRDFDEYYKAQVKLWKQRNGLDTNKLRDQLKKDRKQLLKDRQSKNVRVDGKEDTCTIF